MNSVSKKTADITGITNDEVAADGEVDGTGFAVDASAATAAEVATLLDLTLANADAATSGAKFTISSDAEGEADGSIEITGGTLVDEFGLEVGEVLGVGTQENYLDCQLLGRIAGFDLDAPNGSVGYDNQTVPQTPGNILTNTQRKAIWNASIIAEVPNSAAPICSRTRPVMRDSSVRAETEKAALKRFMRAACQALARPLVEGITKTAVVPSVISCRP